MCSYDFNPATNADVKNWQEYIFHLRGGSSAGSFDWLSALYVNGVLVDSRNDWRMHDGTFLNAVDGFGNGFMVNSHSQTDTDSGYIWVDDFSVDDTFNSNFEAAASITGSSRLSLR